MEIANNIDHAMRISNIKSQAELSRKSGVPESSLTRILKGETLPSLENAVLIAKACKTTVDAIVSGNFQAKTFEITPFPLIRVSQEEVTILSLFREATPLGRSLIRTACDTAEKASTTPTGN